jgi:hypothetical protein
LRGLCPVRCDAAHTKVTHLKVGLLTIGALNSCQAQEYP